MSSVSVVIPCYKYGHFLEESVASVLDDQPGVDVRVLIIDDASPDDSAEVARKIAAESRAWRWLSTRPTRGTSPPSTRASSTGPTGTIASCCPRMTGSPPGPCGAPGTCWTPIPAWGSSTGVRCG